MKTSSLFCVLLMLIAGFLGCLPVSASLSGDSGSDGQDTVSASGGITPMYVAHAHVFQWLFWNIHWTDCDGNTNPVVNTGTHITFASYTGNMILSEAFQTGFFFHMGVGTLEKNYTLYLKNANACSYYQDVDQFGNTRYGSKFTFQVTIPGGTYTITYIASFAVTTGQIWLYQDFNYTRGSPNFPKIMGFEGWWKSFYPQGTVWSGNWGQITHEYAEEAVYWGSAKFQKDPNHWMFTNSWGSGGPNGFSTTRWGAFENVCVKTNPPGFNRRICSDPWLNFTENVENGTPPGELLVNPFGGSYVELDNGNIGLLPGSAYFGYTIWNPTAGD